MPAFKINFLDHVAIRVKDVEKSANWYAKTLGLKKVKTKEWGDFPILLLADKSGIALFPQVEKDNKTIPNLKIKTVDHFAFNVTKINFELAKKSFDNLNVNYNLQNHYYFQSIYIKDLDGHTVELTTILVDENDFYNLGE